MLSLGSRPLVRAALHLSIALAVAMAALTSAAGPLARPEGSAAALGRSGGGTSRVGPGTTIRLPPPTANPPEEGASRSSRPSRPASDATGRTSSASQESTLTAAGGPSAPPTNLPPLWTPPGGAAPTDLTLFQNTALGAGATAGQTSATDEPSIAAFGDDVFYTGNFYAAISTDGGQTFGYLDPYTAFPSIYYGFCCDQRALYVPSSGLVVWALMYVQDSNNNNAIRLAVAQGASGLAANTWTYWDFTALEAQLPDGLMLDYPQLAYSANNLYLTANALNPDGSTSASVIFRCPLSALAASSGGSGGTLPCTNFWLTAADTFTPIDGAISTMYWADHRDNATLQVFSWPESVDWPGVTWAEVPHSAFPSGAYSCPSPDGADMCGSDGWTVRGGWIANGTLGFLWDAAQGTGGLGSFPYPYVHVVEINAASMSLIDEPIIWSGTLGWAYSSVAVNGQGGLGVSVAYSGGSSYPGSAVMARDSLSPTAWQTLNVQEGTNGPPGNRWGDFLTVRTYDGNGTSWVATGYTLQGSCSDSWAPCAAVQPRFMAFGRQDTNPCVSAPLVSSGSISRSSGLLQRRVFLPAVSNGGCLA